VVTGLVRGGLRLSVLLVGNSEIGLEVDPRVLLEGVTAPLSTGFGEHASGKDKVVSDGDNLPGGIGC
jgi:hypothetical protein